MKKSRTLEALAILNGTTMHSPMSARVFAEAMWPDSVMHRKVSNQGNGATKGKAAWLCAGSYLAKLKRKGLVSSYATHGYYLTDEGKKQLASAKTPTHVIQKP